MCFDHIMNLSCLSLRILWAPRPGPTVGRSGGRLHKIIGGGARVPSAFLCFLPVSPDWSYAIYARTFQFPKDAHLLFLCLLL